MASEPASGKSRVSTDVAPRPGRVRLKQPFGQPGLKDTTVSAPASLLGFASNGIAWLQHSYQTEMSGGNQFSWFVVALAGGAALYLTLPAEPSFVALSGLLLAGVALLWVRGRTADTLFLTTVGVMIIAGVWLGALKSIRAEAPRLDHERTVTVSGWILDEEAALKGATRMTIKVATMTATKLQATNIPALISVSFRANTPAFSVGDGIKFVARLRPLPGPVMPGGYDFARHAYFEGRGASGFALGRVEHLDLGPVDWMSRAGQGISQLRRTMSLRIRAALPGARGAIAAAIIVGEQRGIPDAENDAIRMAGLPHMITIAGLHMSIVAGCVFFAIRWLLALVPAIALRFPIKKWAAAGALVATTFYMLISGGHLSAERAYIMSAIMLLAILLGRPALTMRNLAIAAIILIVRDPQQVVEPGFLMSFLAVMSLIAAYQAYARYRAEYPSAPRYERDNIALSVIRAVLNHCLGIMASTLIATFATAWVTADQFFRVSPYSVAANVVVMPAIDFVAMPAAVVACLVMPFGLEALPLTALGWAIDYMDTVGFVAADLPGGAGLVGRIHPWSSPIAIAGLCWLGLWQRSWRLLGVVLLGAALAIAPFSPRPDVMISPDARVIAVRGSDGELKILGAKQNHFIAANWLTADASRSAPADARAPLDPHIADGWRCDPFGCVFEIRSSETAPRHGVAVVTRSQAFDEDCAKADIVISQIVAPDYCSDTALVFDRDQLERTGAVALTFNPAATPRQTEGIHALFGGAVPGRTFDVGDNQSEKQLPDVVAAVALTVSERPWIRSNLAAIETPAKPASTHLAKPPRPASVPTAADAHTDVAGDIATVDELNPLDARDFLQPDAREPSITRSQPNDRVRSRGTKAPAKLAAPQIDPTDLPDMPE